MKAFCRGYQNRLKAVVILLLTLGIFLRFYNLDQKFYWGDEFATSLRISGYTEAEVVSRIYDGRIIDTESLLKFQVPTAERNLSDAVKALMGNPEHPPLYYLLARWWTQFWTPESDNPVVVIRSLSAFISLLVFPGVYWLSLELFESPLPAWMAVAIMAVSPLHILYAQEARQYSLWCVTTLLSSAALLQAVRRGTKLRWFIYGITLILGLYSHLLFILVVLGHGLFVTITAMTNQSGWRDQFQQVSNSQLNRSVIDYGCTTLGGLAFFVPWIIATIRYSSAVEATLGGVQANTSLSYLIDKWLRNINLVFFNHDLAFANIFLLSLVIYSIYFLVRRASNYAWLLILSLLGGTTLPLVLLDLGLGGTRTTTIRYLFPCYLGIQLILAYLFATQLTLTKTWKRRAWEATLIIVAIGGILGQVVELDSELSWSKGNKYELYLKSAQVINQSSQPLVVSDTRPIRIFVLGSYLDSKVKFQLHSLNSISAIPHGFSDIYFFSPSDQLEQVILSRKNLDLDQLDPIVDGKKIQLYRLPSSSLEPEARPASAIAMLQVLDSVYNPH